MLQNFQARRSVCLKELQWLIGLLNFTCLVVVPGRAFLRRMIDLTKGVNKPHHHIHLSRGAKLDIMLWLRFLDDFNGRSSLQLYTDAAGSIGFGAVFDRHWLHGTWPNHWKSYNIALLELLLCRRKEGFFLRDPDQRGKSRIGKIGQDSVIVFFLSFIVWCYPHWNNESKIFLKIFNTVSSSMKGEFRGGLRRPRPPLLSGNLFFFCKRLSDGTSSFVT